MTPAKNIVITGASSGIGAALALRLSSDGHRVTLAARRETELKAIARRAGSNAVAVTADVTRRGDVERLRDAALAKFSHIDVWVNNAGQGITRRVIDLTDEDLDRMIAVNLKSALYGMQAAVPHFIERGSGHVINVSSMLSRIPFATYRSAYNAAKAALNAFTANLRADLAAAHPGIHVSLVIPGLVTTDFGQHAIGGSPPLPPAALRDAQSPEEVADRIASLIEQPVAEIYTNPQHRDRVVAYFQDVEKFERDVAARR